MKQAILLLLVAVAAGAFGQPVAHARPATTHPTLRLMDAEPVAFHGAGFKARERVRVVVVAGTRAAKSVTASAGGSFVVRFTGVGASSCAGFTATAIGNDGSRATFKRAPGQCPAP